MIQKTTSYLSTVIISGNTLLLLLLDNTQRCRSQKLRTVSSWLLIGLNLHERM